MSKKELVKRWFLFVLCLFFMGVGVAFTKHGNLGVSPISSVANVVSLKFTFLSFGTWLTISNCILLLGQILLLRKNFKLIQLLQIPLSFLFGFFTDAGLIIAGVIQNDNYIIRILLVVVGVVILGFGIAIADVSKKDFSSVKIIFDVSWVMLSIVISLILFKGEIHGTREGTIISALLVGATIKFFRPLLQKPITKILKQ